MMPDGEFDVFGALNAVKKVLAIGAGLDSARVKTAISALLESDGVSPDIWREFRAFYDAQSRSNRRIIRKNKCMVYDYPRLRAVSKLFELYKGRSGRSIVFNYWNDMLAQSSGLKPGYVFQNIVDSRGIPTIETTRIERLKHDSVGKNCFIRGIVKKVVKPASYLRYAVFRCLYCGAKIAFPQNLAEYKTGRCVCTASKRGQNVQLDADASTYVEYQRLWLQNDCADSTLIQVYMPLQSREHLKPGQNLLLTGYLDQYMMASGPGSKLPCTVKYVLVKSCKSLDKRKNLQLTDYQVSKFVEYSRHPSVVNALVRGFAPGIYGYNTLKLALLMQIVGGVQTLVGQIKYRGDIHVLLLGDPGTAKSLMLQEWYRLMGGTYASGASASSVGLTASLCKTAAEGWTLEAGALVLAHKSWLAIDQLDKFVLPLPEYLFCVVYFSVFHFLPRSNF